MDKKRRKTQITIETHVDMNRFASPSHPNVVLFAISLTRAPCSGPLGLSGPFASSFAATCISCSYTSASSGASTPGSMYCA